MELEKSRLLADMKQPTDTLFGLSLAIGSLRARIESGPEWWKQGLGMGIEDEDALVALYEKVETEVLAWRSELVEKAQEAQKALGK